MVYFAMVLWLLPTSLEVRQQMFLQILMFSTSLYLFLSVCVCVCVVVRHFRARFVQSGQQFLSFGPMFTNIYLCTWVPKDEKDQFRSHWCILFHLDCWFSSHEHLFIGVRTAILKVIWRIVMEMFILTIVCYHQYWRKLFFIINK